MGCLVDMAERTMMVTLNGAVQFNNRGSELAAKDFDIMDGKSVSYNGLHSIANAYA